MRNLRKKYILLGSELRLAVGSAFVDFVSFFPSGIGTSSEDGLFGTVCALALVSASSSSDLTTSFFSFFSFGLTSSFGLVSSFGFSSSLGLTSSLGFSSVFSVVDSVFVVVVVVSIGFGSSLCSGSFGLVSSCLTSWEISVLVVSWVGSTVSVSLATSVGVVSAGFSGVSATFGCSSDVVVVSVGFSSSLCSIFWVGLVSSFGSTAVVVVSSVLVSGAGVSAGVVEGVSGVFSDSLSTGAVGCSSSKMS